MTEHESHPNAPKRTMLRMKWNRKLFNKVELTRQQRHFEACVEELKTLEKIRRQQHLFMHLPQE